MQGHKWPWDGEVQQPGLDFCQVLLCSPGESSNSSSTQQAVAGGDPGGQGAAAPEMEVHSSQGSIPGSGSIIPISHSKHEPSRLQEVPLPRAVEMA